jgi:hypothetical protein
MSEFTADALAGTFEFDQLAEVLLLEVGGIPCAHGCVSAG